MGYNLSMMIDDIDKIGKLQAPDKVPVALLPLCRLMFEHYQKFQMPEFYDPEYEIFEAEEVHYDDEDDTDIVVCMSGGFVSLATLFFYVDSDNYDIRIFHKGNYKSEASFVKMIGERLNIPVFHLKEPYHKNYPLRTLEVINSAIKYCVEEEIPFNIAIGSIYNCDLNMNQFAKYGSNSKEVIDAYENAMRYVLGKSFYIRRPLPQMDFAWEIMMRHRRYLDKVDVDNDMLYIVKCDHNIQAPNKNKYMAALNHIRDKYKENTGLDVADKYELWKKCFFYSIRKSKYYDCL